MQTSRQWMITHEWMVKGNRQTEWIEKRGALIWLAFYFGGLGGGLYLVSLVFNNWWGMLGGWIVASLLKGMLNFSDLGRPARFWRLAFNPKTSWLSRGLLSVVLFTGFGFIQILISYLIPEQTAIIIIFRIISGIFALSVISYTGFTLNNVKGIPLWSLLFLPAMFIVWGILGGLGLMAAVSLLANQVDFHAVEAASIWLSVFNFVLLGVYLISAIRKGMIGKQSVLYQIKGDITHVFWAGIILFCLVILVNLRLLNGDTSEILLVTGIFSQVISCLLMTYCALKSAIYHPIMTRMS